MSPASELRSRVRAYLDGQASIRDLHCWIGGHISELYGDTDCRTVDLTDEIWLLISDYADQLIREADLHDELRRMVRPEPISRAYDPRPRGVSCSAGAWTIFSPPRFLTASRPADTRHVAHHAVTAAPVDHPPVYQGHRHIARNSPEANRLQFQAG